MTINFEMKELNQRLSIVFEDEHDENEVLELIDNFYFEWLNYDTDECDTDEEMWAEIENTSPERWIIDHLDDYGYSVKSYELLPL